MPDVTVAAPASPPFPYSFLEYLRSFGPGIVIVLTWLGAGDVVDMGVAGANYGYSLMWVLVVAIVLASCSSRSSRATSSAIPTARGSSTGWPPAPAYAPVLFAAAVVMSHVYQSYMTGGAGEVCRNLFGRGETWQWAIVGNAIALLLVARPSYPRLELVFKLLLALLALSFLGRRSGWASIPRISRAASSASRCPAATAATTRCWSRSR